MSSEEFPRTLGPYTLLVPLAQGGMGSVVIAAPAAEPGRLCLLKLLKPGLASQEDYLPRFIDESKVAVALSHENLCRVLGSGEAAGELFLEMELIEGVTLKRLVELATRGGRKPTQVESIALVVNVLRGLHAAHVAVLPGTDTPLGVVHRDVSPQNAMLDVHGRVKVIDFGLATSVLKETFTESAVVLGKASYMAPEQARGEECGTAVDQYAAAIMLYELLAGERFYGELTQRAIWTLAGAGTHKPKSWSLLPSALVPVVSRALCSRPADRFRSCAAFADALLLAVPEAASPNALESLGQFVREQRPRELRKIDDARALAEELRDQSSAPVDVAESNKRRAAQRGDTELVRRSSRTFVVAAGGEEPGTNSTRRVPADVAALASADPQGSRLRAALLVSVVVVGIGGATVAAAMMRTEPVSSSSVGAKALALPTAAVRSESTSSADSAGAAVAPTHVDDEPAPAKPAEVTGTSPRPSTPIPPTRKALSKDGLTARARLVERRAAGNESECGICASTMQMVALPLLAQEKLDQAERVISRCEKQCGLP